MQYVYLTLGAVSILYLILIFLTSPSAKKHKAIEVIQNKYIAHRGLHDKTRPENSISAFEAAVKKGYPIEIDVHLTKDGKVVVFHDGTLKRMCGAQERIADLTLHQLKKYSLSDSNETIPTLSECLEAVNGKVPLLIEFKMENGNTKALCKAANQILSGYKGDYLIQSFFPQVVRWYKIHRKDVCRGQLSCNFKKKSIAKWLSANLLLNFMGRPHFISYRHSDASKLMLRFSKWQGGYPIGWTFQSKEDLEKNKKHFNTWIFEGFSPEDNNEAERKEK